MHLENNFIIIAFPLNTVHKYIWYEAINIIYRSIQTTYTCFRIEVVNFSVLLPACLTTSINLLWLCPLWNTKIFVVCKIKNILDTVPFMDVSTTTESIKMLVFKSFNLHVCYLAYFSWYEISCFCGIYFCLP